MPMCQCICSVNVSSRDVYKAIRLQQARKVVNASSTTAATSPAPDAKPASAG